MKRSFLLLCAVLLAAAAPLTPARAQDAVSIDFFYDALSPYGDWIYTPNYGYVWQPLTAQQPGWSPYADGSWAFTDAGWTWVSNEDFGWLTYHYGRWIRMQQNWMWVPGYEWAPAWVSWRQTQGQIGWAPLPPEAAWVPGIGFGGWTDSYYDVGPSYYNFVPIGMFASQTSLRPLILDRSRNFTYYDQSVNVTHTSYQQNVMNHIFVGGPDPQRIDGLGSNHVRRLTLRRDDEGFRRDWIDHDRRGGGPPHVGGFSRIEQDHLIVAAPSIRRDASHALPARVREPIQQPEIDRGWRGAADVQGAERVRQQQRDELARTRPPNLPDKNLQPATSTAPPPAFGRVLQPEERIGGGGAGKRPDSRDPRHMTEEVRPATPVPAGGPPGIPGRKNGEPGTVGVVPQAGMPHREQRREGPQGEGQRGGMGPGENNVPPAGVVPHIKPGFPGGPPNSVPQPAVPQQPVRPQVPATPPQNIPNAPQMNRGAQGQRGQPQGRSPAEEQHRQRPQPGTAPVAPPHVAPAPIQPQRPQAPPPVRPLPPQGGNAPRVMPVAPPHQAPPNQAPPHNAPPQGNPPGRGRR